MERKTGEINGEIIEKKGELELKTNEMQEYLNKNLKKKEGEIKNKNEERGTGKFKGNENLGGEKVSIDELKEATIKTKLSAEKILNDLIGGLMEKQNEWGGKIVEHNAECETPLTDVLENDSSIIIRWIYQGLKKRIYRFI